PWSRTIQIADDASTDRIEVPVLEDELVEAAPAAASDRPGPEERPLLLVTNDGSTQRTVGILVGAAGILAGIGGIGVFALAKSEESKSDQFAADAEGETGARRADLESASRSRRQAAESNQLIAIILGGSAAA